MFLLSNYWDKICEIGGLQHLYCSLSSVFLRKAERKICTFPCDHPFFVGLLRLFFKITNEIFTSSITASTNSEYNRWRNFMQFKDLVTLTRIGKSTALYLVLPHLWKRHWKRHKMSLPHWLIRPLLSTVRVSLWSWSSEHSYPLSWQDN